ncbi:metal ABC transporter solute-binding protein, Zn/Mn family [Bifidobacterium moukalabense]|jgi:zinc/manganese transport system substrate-binding protein|uniref:ABC transporter substrate-binding protein n=1 Tax=Bifidobacterium moukalabense DSM 27321 TaxID=1435051 RepID=W4N8F3_9BIFI|nr:zinc ABC transporter substrate-binding protein [Bifidobacterium moukalabense]ETY71353.1 ABC transporter substrate-binding protein [Bifidobacterium moukalabense DSM 27321]
MRLHQRSLLRAIATGIVTCMVFGATACFGHGSADDQPTSSSSTTAQTSPITVVASVNQWGSLAEQIGGTHVKVTSILGSTSVDAHDFEPKTADIAILQKAQVVVSNGAGYDTWATKNLTKGSVSVSAAQMVGAMEGDNPHLWFSNDARNAMAKELADTYSRIMPARKKYFADRLSAWNKRESKVEKAMKSFSNKHKGATYAATEAVAYYLMSDMGFDDKTPEGYAQSAASDGEPAPADLQAFQELLEKHQVDLLVNNVQEASDATNLLTGTAQKSDVPVFDVTEQMPADQSNLTSWILSLVTSLTEMMTTNGAEDDSSENETASPGESSDSASPSEDATEEPQPDPGK